MTIAAIQSDIAATEQRLAALKVQLREERMRAAVERIRAEPGGMLWLAIGVAVQKARKAEELTQEDLAKRVGVLRTSIVNIEKGRQRLPIDLLYDIADALGVQAVDLLPRNEDV